MSSKKKLKNITIFSALISLISFIYKISLSFMTMSIVLMVASVSTLLVFLCKLLFVRNVYDRREQKKKVYFRMALVALLYSGIFILFVVLKVNGIDISNKNKYDGLVGILLIGFMLLMFILSVLGLRGALEKTDILVIGLKEMTFISALADLVIILEFVTRVILKYYNVRYLELVMSYVPLVIGGLMLVTTFIMFVRFFRYKVEKV